MHPDAASDGGVVDNLIIGSGFGALATAKALRARGASFEVLDIADDLEADARARADMLAQMAPSAWPAEEKERLFPPAAASTKGVTRRLAFGSDFPYRIPSPLRVRMEDCETELAHGLGGFGNVWGAAMLPYDERALRDWPIDPADLDRSYRNVLAYTPLSGEEDGLVESFPLHTDRPGRSRPLGSDERALERPRRPQGSVGRQRRRVRASAGGGERAGLPVVRGVS